MKALTNIKSADGFIIAGADVDPEQFSTEELAALIEAGALEGEASEDPTPFEEEVPSSEETPEEVVPSGEATDGAEEEPEAGVEEEGTSPNEEGE